MIRIVVTGGTFDKTYDEIQGRLSFVETTIETLMMIDSLDMTDADRGRIVAACAASPEDRIVITHGTDTMVETARAVAQGITGKTIVLTGAMVPYAFGSSDGLFNLGSALSFVQVLPPGVYVAMNGQWFDWDNVVKTVKDFNDAVTDAPFDPSKHDGKSASGIMPVST